MDFSEELKIYYKRVFPCDLFAKWLTYGSVELCRREFSFTLAGDIYLRYQSFDSGPDMRRKLIELCPHKIDIGAVYSTAPKKQRSLSFSMKPEWKELVFDIDLTDYDDVRYCCGTQSDSSAPVCSRCWTLAKSAVVCIDRALREDFGFEHILWVYSGRRGIHCWVCDSSARNLDQSARTAIVEYLTLVRAGDTRQPSLTAGTHFERDDKNGPEPMLHPCVDAAFDILLPKFNQFASTIQGQDLFGVSDRLAKLLSHLPPELSQVRQRLTDDWTGSSSAGSGEISLRRWNTLQSFLKENGRYNATKGLVLRYIYPRLDANVTTGINHLLKSPFCVHPKTGHICVPFDPLQVDLFDPSKAPTLSQLIDELSVKSVGNDSADSATNFTSSGPHLLAYKKTSLRTALDYFEGFVQRLCSNQSIANGLR